MNKPETTHFGFKTIPVFEKSARVERLFQEVSGHYDSMNDAMSMGLHRIWKDRFVSRITFEHQANILDVASGTGDILLRLLKKARAENKEINATALDLTAEMMTPARDRILNEGLSAHVNWIQGNAEELPFEDNSLDLITISFGLRNVTHIDKALAEFHRVLKPGGQFYCLEFSHIYVKPMRKLYQLYAFNLIPKIGKLIAKNEDAYQYLVESIEKFPSQEKLSDMMRAHGFDNVNFQNMNFGLVAMHWGDKT